MNRATHFVLIEQADSGGNIDVAVSPTPCNRVWFNYDGDVSETEIRNGTTDVEQVTCGHCIKSAEYLEAMKTQGKEHLLFEKMWNVRRK